MSMNIKDEEVHRLTRQLATLTGESLTMAVATSVRERLERLKDQSDIGLSERLMQISRETAPLFKPPYDTIDHADLLYDEDGLPK